MATLITGATGFVGQRLISLTNRPIVTSRNRQRAMDKLGDSVSEVIQWDPMSGPLPIDPTTNIDCVINLMGESIADGRPFTVRDARNKRFTKLLTGIGCHAIGRRLEPEAVHNVPAFNFRF